MRPRHTLALAVFLGSAVAASPQDAPTRKGPKGQSWEQDELEEKTIKNAVERAIKSADNESSRWQKEMNKAFPDRAPVPTSEQALDKWYDLLADGGKVWRR